jgi:hypothetical protein
LLKSSFITTTHVHTRLIRQEAITEFGWTVFPHPPYSIDTAPSDFHLFGALRDAIRGKSFGSYDEVVEEVQKGLRVQN